MNKLNVYFKVAGIANGHYQFPQGIKIGDSVRLIHEKDNKYDPNAIAIWYQDTQLGYVAKASNKNMPVVVKDDMQGFTVVDCDIQNFIIAENIQEAIISWLKEPVSGKSHSIELTLDRTPPFAYKNMQKQYRHYNKEGNYVLAEYMPFTARKQKGLYMSITSFLSYHVNKYSIGENLDRLRAYQATRTEQHVLDAQARYGTAIHEFIEYITTGKSKTADKIAKIINGLEFVEAEKTTYDDDLMLAGTMDYRAKDEIIDWKSGSYESPAHKYQLCFYCKNESIQKGRIVYFGVDTQKGYKEVTLYQDKIYLGYEFIKNLVK